jgi:hypothetical protein
MSTLEEVLARFDAPDTACAQYLEEDRLIELCVYEDDQEEYVARKDGRCFRLSRGAAEPVLRDLGATIGEFDRASN